MLVNNLLADGAFSRSLLIPLEHAILMPTEHKVADKILQYFSIWASGDIINTWVYNKSKSSHQQLCLTLAFEGMCGFGILTQKFQSNENMGTEAWRSHARFKLLPPTRFMFLFLS